MQTSSTIQLIPIDDMAQQIQELNRRFADSIPVIQQSVARLLEAANTHTLQLESLLELSSSQEAKLESLLELSSSQALDLNQAVDLLIRYLQAQESLEETLNRVDTRTKRLSPEHALAVQNAVGHIVRAVRKKNAAITEQVAHRMVYGRLKSHFGPVTSYREINDDCFLEIMEYLRKEYRTIRDTGPTQETLF